MSPCPPLISLFSPHFTSLRFSLAGDGVSLLLFSPLLQLKKRLKSAFEHTNRMSSQQLGVHSVACSCIVLVAFWTKKGWVEAPPLLFCTEIWGSRANLELLGEFETESLESQGEIGRRDSSRFGTDRGHKQDGQRVRFLVGFIPNDI